MGSASVLRVFSGREFKLYQPAKTIEGAKSIAAQYRLHRGGSARVTPITDKNSPEYQDGFRYLVWTRG